MKLSRRGVERWKTGHPWIYQTDVEAPKSLQGGEVVRVIDHRATVELSGGINLDNVRLYAETGADFVSAGAITHSARAMDISFRLELA